MKTLGLGAVILGKQLLLMLRQHHDLRLGVFIEHGALVFGKVLVAPEPAIHRVAQGLGLVLEHTVGGKVQVQPRHLVEAHHAVYRALGQVGLNPGVELFVAAVVDQGLDRRHQHFKAWRDITFPDQGVHPNLVAALLALQRDAHEVALQATEREVLVQNKSQLHQCCSSASNNVLSRLATRSGFKRVKHRGDSRAMSNRRRSSAVG